MKFTMNHKVFMILFLCGIPALFAQQGGSNYSMYGIGDIRQSMGGFYDGLGGTQYAVPSYHAVNLANPAMWAESKLTRLQIGFRFTQTAIEQDQLSASQNFGKIDGIAATFQVDTSMGLTISGGIHPFSVVQYSVMTPVTPGVTGIADLAGGSMNFGSGGISAAFIGSSWRPVEGISLGFAAMRLFGNVNRVIRTELYTQPFISQNVKTDRFFGSGIKLGASFQPFKGFTLGMGAGLFSDLEYESDIRQSTATSSSVAFDTVFMQSGITTLPAQLGLGISYSTGRWMFAGDVEMQDFSNLAIAQGKSAFKTGRKISFAVSRLRSYQLGTDYIDKMQLNVGGGWHQLYYSVNGIDIEEVFGSVGMQLPIAGSAMIDIALQGGKRGSSDLVQEMFLRFGFSVSAGEVWFRPFIRE
ncbi:MAG: hypothetical protein FJ219_05735 [Ignavibacteria bacterium]|nr:hypothetical protein [Ignavibacteria bacterium]